MENQNSINQKQQRHEELIDLMNKFHQYQDKDGKSLLKKRSKQIGSKDLINLSEEEINNGVVVFTDYLNLSGGSISDIDLYQLLQAYFLKLKKRDAINKIIRSDL